MNETIHRYVLKKNGPNNRLIKKEKSQIIYSTNFKGGIRKKPIAFVIKPRPILTKHTQLCTIVMIHCYHSEDDFVSEISIWRVVKEGNFSFKSSTNNS